MKVKAFAVGPLEQNTYILSDETGEAVMIDCGVVFPAEEDKVVEYIQQEGLVLKRLILTHAHFDHACGVPFVYHVFGVSAEFGRADQFLYDTMSQQVKRFLRADITFDMPVPQGYLKGGDTVKFGNSELLVIDTPGHTPGGLSFYCKDEHAVWSGDTLFNMSVGRTDLGGGDADVLLDSIRKGLLTLPGDTDVMTGHGPSTTIANEKAYNPYL